MHTSPRISKRARLRAFVLRSFHSDQPVSYTSSPCLPVETHDYYLKPTVSKAHSPSSLPPIQTRSGGPDLVALNNRVRFGPPSTLPAGNYDESHNMPDPGRGALSAPPLSSMTSYGFPPGNAHNSSPHLPNHGGGPNIADPITQSRSPPSPSLSPSPSPSPSPTEPYSNDGAMNTGANLFHRARHFKITKSVFTVGGVQGKFNTVSQGMNALSEHSIKGAAYDSRREPLPQCHGGTRVQLQERIIVWFRGNQREKALLWLNGPAGVGKSALIQTVAESLAESKSVGATLFFSRLNNDRNDPHRVFITIAFQLATRIPEYQTHITELIALDPSLLEKGMKEQFRIFITEPFGNEKIGKGKGPWAILLDGLDECEGVEEQSKIARLVSEFVVDFPDTPLVWAIASRPEPHLVATFLDKKVASSYWPEYMSVDSDEACQDVKHYLDTSFEAMRRPFPHLPSNWPSEGQSTKLSQGAQGLFAFARTAVRFMEDPNHADPVSRLELILSIIDHLDIKVVGDHPFELLDALYTQILKSIPPSVWLNTKKILGFLICTRSYSEDEVINKTIRKRFPHKEFLYPLNPQSHNLPGASIILGLPQSLAHASLYKLHSVLKISNSQSQNLFRVTLLHTSFGDYLTDRERSKDFYIDRREFVDDIAEGLFKLYLEKPWDTNWERYSPSVASMGAPDFHGALREDAEDSLHYVVTGELRTRRGRGPFKSEQDRSDCLDALRRINPVEVHKNSFFTDKTILFLVELWKGYREELESTGLFKEIQLRNLRTDHLGQETNPPTFISKNRRMIYSLKSLQLFTDLLSGHGRETPVIIYGSLPENQIAFFEGTFEVGDDGYFCLLYPY